VERIPVSKADKKKGKEALLAPRDRLVLSSPIIISGELTFHKDGSVNKECKAFKRGHVKVDQNGQVNIFSPAIVCGDLNFKKILEKAPAPLAARVNESASTSSSSSKVSSKWKSN